jgi:maltose O-acetyltransferase
MRIPFHLYNLVSQIMPARCHRLRSWLLRRCGAVVGHGVSLNARVLVYGAYLEIGDETWVSPETIFFTGPEGFVKIGSNCDIGPGVTFVTGSHVIGNFRRRAGLGFSKPICIGNGCWLGARSVILGGVKIGDGCIVASGAIVRPGEYPDHVLLAGVPGVAPNLPDTALT